MAHRSSTGDPSLILHCYSLVWYFALSGFSVEAVQQVFKMFPEALAIPLKVEGFNTNRYFLLEAACKAGSGARDDVISFVAMNYPDARSVSFDYSLTSMPFQLRIIDGPRFHETEHASLETVKALVPRECWTLGFVGRLFSVGYDDVVLNYAVDMLRSHGNTPAFLRETFLIIESTGQDRHLLDHSRALVLERLLCPSGGDPHTSSQVRDFQFSPKAYTLEFFNHTLKCIKASNTVESLNLAIDQAPNQESLELLEELFAANRTIYDLTLKVQNEHLAAILRGLERAGTQTLRKMRLHGNILDISILEPFLAAVSSPMEIMINRVTIAGHWSSGYKVPGFVRFSMVNCRFPDNLLVETINFLARPTILDTAHFGEREAGAGDSIDMNEFLSQVLGTGHLVELRVSGRHSYDVDVGALVSALQQDTILRSLEFQKAPSSLVEEHRMSNDLLALLKHNSTLEKLIVFNLKGLSKYVDYTGFSTVEHIRGRTPHIHTRSCDGQMAYYMRLNKFGRHKVRTESTTLEDFISLLDAAMTELMERNQLAYFNVVFGLLQEYEPNKWLPSTRVKKLPHNAEMREPSREEMQPSSRSHPNVLYIKNAYLCYPLSGKEQGR
jgi:hypothetical protein